MGTRLVHRPARLKVDSLPTDPLKLPAAPAIDAGNANPMMAMRAILPIFAGLGMMAMMMSSGNPIRMIAGGAMVVAAVVGGIGMFIYTKTGGRKKAEQQRGVFVEFVAEAKERLERESADQRAASVRRHPDPRSLPVVIRDPSRLWERRPHDDDFLVVRIGRGTGPLARDVDVPEQSDPLKRPEPIAQAHLDRLLAATERIEDLPVTVPLTGVVSVIGPAAVTYEAVRAMLSQAATLHAPDDVRIHIALPAAGASTAYEWAMWLPHLLDPDQFDGPIARRMTSRDSDDLVSLVDEIDRRAELAEEATKRVSTAAVGIDAPRLIVVVDSDDHHGREVLSVLASHDLQAMKVVAIVLNEHRTLEPGHVDSRITIDGNRSLQVEIFESDEPTDGPRVDAASRRRRRLVRGADRGSLDVVSEALASTVARRLSPIRLVEDAAPDAPLETTITLDRLLGISDFGTYDIDRMWEPRPLDEFLNVPFAVGGDGEPVHLNLKESAQEGMGPHGLCIGATGSGKSEVLRTMVLAQAVCHHPDRLALVLVDYKGGAAFAGLDQLPHTTAMVDNLSDGSGLVDRLHDALLGEMQRRQQVLQAAGSLPNVTEYNRRRDAGQDLEPLPNLLVVIDEFGEILAAKPDFIDLFVQVGRIGRSIGVHLLLATQRLEESKLRGLESHLSYRIGLRTFSAQESRTVIGTADAHQLPPIPGSGILKVDPDLYQRFKAAYVSGRYVPASDVEELQLPPIPMPFQLGNDTSHWLHERQLEHESSLQKKAAEPKDDPFVETTLDMVARRLGAHAEKVRQIWLPPLPSSIPIGDILGGVSRSRSRGLTATNSTMCGELRFPIGLKDQPLKQWQGPLTIDFRGSGGHLVFLGSPQSGKTTAVRALVTGAALTHTPSEVGFYVIDMAGSGLSPLARLPHVGDVATRFDVDKLRRSVAETSLQLAERERLFAYHHIETADQMRDLHRRGGLPELACADVFLVIDGWWTFREEYESLSHQVHDIVARGLGYGVHVVLTTSRWADFRLQMQSMLGSRIELRLNDSIESTIDRRVLQTIRPEDQGRCATQDKLLGQIGLPIVGGEIGDTDATFSAIAEAWSGPVVPAVRMLPDEVPLAGVRTDHPTAPRAVIGLAEADLMPVSIDLFGADPHLLVFGDSGSGKTTLVRTLIDDICPGYREGQVVFAVIDPKRQLLDAVPAEFLGGYAGTSGAANSLMGSIVQELQRRQPPDDVTPQQLRDRSWWTGPEVVVIADDYDMVEGGASPLRQLVPFLPQARDLGIHLVVLRRSGGAGRAAYEHVMQGIKESGGTGLLLSGDRQEGQIWPKTWMQRLPPGRADLIRSGRSSERIQIAFTPRPEVQAADQPHTAQTNGG